MAASSEFSQNKRARHEYWNGGLALPEAKRINSGKLVGDGDLTALLEKIDNMDANKSNPEETRTVIQLEDELRLDDVTKFLEDEIGLKTQTNYKIESTEIKGSSTNQMGSNRQSELTANHGNSEATLVMSDIGDFMYYDDDVRPDLDFFLDHNITPDDFSIIMQNSLDRESVPDIMYLYPVQGYAETTEVSYDSLWEDDIWQLNEHQVVQNDFASPQQEELGINGAEFGDVWK